jgi:hypothetical protein
VHFFLVHIRPLGSGSGFGSELRIRIRIQEPIESDFNPDPQHWFPASKGFSNIAKLIVQATGEAFSPQRKTSSTSKEEIYQLIYFFLGHFCSFDSELPIRIQGPHRIRIRSGYGSGSTTLVSRVSRIQECRYAVNVFQIKRHLWRDNQSLFGDEVSPLLSQYIKDKENVLFSHEVGSGAPSCHVVGSFYVILPSNQDFP